MQTRYSNIDFTIDKIDKKSTLGQVFIFTSRLIL